MKNKFLKIRSEIQIGTHFRVLTIILVFLVLVLGFFSIKGISELNSKAESLQQGHSISVVNLTILTEKLYSAIIENHILLSDRKSIVKLERKQTINMEEIQEYLNEYEESLQQGRASELFGELIIEYQKYTNINKEIILLVRNNLIDLAVEKQITTELESFNQLQSILKKMLAVNLGEINKTKKEIASVKNKVLKEIIILLVLALILIIISTKFIKQNIEPPLKALFTYLTTVSDGHIPSTKLTESDTEIGQMSKKSNLIGENLDSLNVLAKKLSDGDYYYNTTDSLSDHTLGRSLINLQENLKQAKEEEEHRKEEEEHRSWATEGLAKFSEILRQNIDDLQKLADEVLKNIVYYSDSVQGGLFVLDEKGTQLNLISTFAYDRKKFISKTINIGDGLLGMCALEKNTIHITDIPEGYIEIESGLGNIKPTTLLIVPLKLDDELLGVIEIASLIHFPSYKVRFMEDLGEIIASTLSSVKINARTAELLTESQKQSEILAAQEVEMRKTMSEMRATQEEAVRQEAEMRGILTAVDNTLMKGEYEINGTLITVNQRHLNTMGYRLDEIQGKNIEMFIPQNELQEFRVLWKSVCRGNPHQIQVKRKSKIGKVLWLLNQYTPVIDDRGKILKILYVAFNITEQKLREEEFEKQSQLLESQDIKMKKQLHELTQIHQ